MKCIKVEIKKTQKIKEYLIKKNLIDNNYEFKKDKAFFCFPVLKPNQIKSKFPFVKIVDVKLKKKIKKKTLKKSYDVIGKIMILEKGNKTIAENILKRHKHISTVLNKEGGRKGTFRLQKYGFLSGEKKYETIHKENNVRIKINLKKMYFSPRLSNERKRITKQIKKDEMVLVMFSGSGVYPLVISKNSDAKFIYGVEINKEAYKYAEENIKLNKINNIKLFCGDVRKIVPKLKKRFNRVIMPLPRKGENYLDIALNISKKNTIIHFYDFLDEKDIPKKSYEKIKKICKKLNKKYKILRCVKAGQFSPRKYRVCVDFKAL